MATTEGGLRHVGVPHPAQYNSLKHLHRGGKRALLRPFLGLAPQPGALWDASLQFQVAASNQHGFSEDLRAQDGETWSSLTR